MVMISPIIESGDQYESSSNDSSFIYSHIHSRAHARIVLFGAGNELNRRASF